MERLNAFRELLRTENERQNLVSRPSLEQFWLRHAADSAQLLQWAPTPEARWIDLGTGAGFPGLVIAALHHGPVTLVEERKLRSEFLGRAADLLGVSPKTEIVGRRVERVESRAFDVISARAFAPLPRLLELGARFSTNKTRWILPKGRNASSELESVESTWHGRFRIEPSVTDPEAGIIVAEAVRKRP
jgi:16S rRNA (guanine527-N7)-methyltransferase